MTQPLPVLVYEAADYTVVSPQGRIFFDTVKPLRDTLVLVATPGRPRVVVDLSAVDVCDSSGLNLMVEVHRTVTDHGGWLRLVGVQPMVRRIFDITNLTRLLPIYASVDDALHNRPSMA